MLRAESGWEAPRGRLHMDTEHALLANVHRQLAILRRECIITPVGLMQACQGTWEVYSTVIAANNPTWCSTSRSRGAVNVCCEPCAVILRGGRVAETAAAAVTEASWNATCTY